MIANDSKTEGVSYTCKPRGREQEDSWVSRVLTQMPVTYGADVSKTGGAFLASELAKGLAE